MKNVGLLLISVLAFGCATTKYGFRPAGPVTTSEGGFPASRYAVPPEAPRGEVFVTSFGVRDVESGPSRELIHVRLAVANQTGDRPWSVDPAQQLLVGPGGAAQRPDYMESDGRQDGTNAIATGQRRVFDLYYRLPANAPDVGAVPGFNFQWQVNAGDRLVNDRTVFAREEMNGGEEDRGQSRVSVGVSVVGPWWAYGYGPGWYGPLWWGYPYYGGAYWGGGWGYSHRPYYGGGGGYYGGRGAGFGPRYGGGGGGFGRGGGGAVRAPTVRGRPR